MTWQDVEDKIRAMPSRPQFVTATDGNHGYALAYAAKLLQCPAYIFMPKVWI